MENEKKKKGLFGWLFGVVKKFGLIFIIGFGAAVIFYVVISAILEPVSTAKFCGTYCHEMEYVYKSWQKSPHAVNSRGIEVNCVDCHLPPKEEFIAHLVAKVKSGTEGLTHYFGEYDAEKAKEKAMARMTNDKCMRCHKLLLEAPGDMQEFHQEVLAPAEGEEPLKCIECHEDTGHVWEE